MEELVNLIKSNNIIELQKALEYTDINIVDNANNTLLHYSIKYHKYEITYYLLAKGINTNCLNIYGLTPLMMAVKFDLFNIVSALIDNNANPLIYDNNFEDAIYMAYKYGRENIIEYFENKYSYNIDKSNKNGENLLFALVRSHNYKLVLKYINDTNIFKVDKYNNTLLMLAVYINDYDITKYLLDISQLNINSYNNYNNRALDIALENNNYNIIKLLLNYGAFTNFYLKNKSYINKISALENELLNYDLTNYYSINNKLIYYYLQDDITMFSKSINYNNVTVKDKFNKNILDYIKISKNYIKNNKYYQLLCHFDKKLI